MNSNKPRVLCTINLSDVPEAMSVLEGCCHIEFVASSREAVVQRIAGCEVLWSSFDFKVDKGLLEQGQRLKAVVTATTGTDHLDKEEMRAKGITLISLTRDMGLLKTFSSTAECAWMLLLTCARNFRLTNAAANRGQWEQRPFVGKQLRGLTLGVLGVGRLGSMTVEFGKSFGMKVLGCDRERIAAPGVTQVDFEKLLEESDAVMINIHMTPENRHLFNAAAFARMKQGAILVNTSRGDIVDEEALLAALESGRVGAYGADVVHDEWRPDMENQTLIAYARGHANVVITPHIGGTTSYTLGAARVFAARKLAHYLKTGQVLEWL